MLRDYSVGPPGAILFRRDVFATVGLFDETISPAADYDMSIRVARRFPICVHDHVVLDYRRHGASMSSNPASMLSTTVRALRKQWPEARQSRETRLAYREGMRHWRGTWGRFLVDKIRSDLSKRRYRRAAREAWMLLRYHPAGLIQVLTKPIFKS